MLFVFSGDVFPESQTAESEADLTCPMKHSAGDQLSAPFPRGGNSQSRLFKAECFPRISNHNSGINNSKRPVNRNVHPPCDVGLLRGAVKEFRNQKVSKFEQPDHWESVV